MYISEDVFTDLVLITVDPSKRTLILVSNLIAATLSNNRHRCWSNGLDGGVMIGYRLLVKVQSNETKGSLHPQNYITKCSQNPCLLYARLLVSLNLQLPIVHSLIPLILTNEPSLTINT